MKKIAVLVSGGGTNLQALIDAVKAGKIKNGEIAAVISSKGGAYSPRARQKGGNRDLCCRKKGQKRRAVRSGAYRENRFNRRRSGCYGGVHVHSGRSVLQAL